MAKIPIATAETLTAIGLLALFFGEGEEAPLLVVPEAGGALSSTVLVPGAVS